MRKNLKKSAFTLAEVLITLTIIGVIAVIVIPNLMQRHFEQEMVSKLKKNYNVLNNAIQLAIRENGPVDEWDIGDEPGTQQGAQNMFDYLKPYLKVSKDCGTTSNKCFSRQYKTMFGNVEAFWASLTNDRSYYKFILDDGTAIALDTNGKGCARVTNRYNSFKKSCCWVFVDLNNTKGPNKYGWDMFPLTITEKNVMPAGIEYSALTNTSKGHNCKYNDSGNKYNGAYCAAHVIYKGNMDYLHRYIESEWQ